MSRLEYKVALVTGAGSGIGRAIARAFAREGAAVAVNDIFEDRARKVADEIAASGGRSLAVPADVADGRKTLLMFTRFLNEWSTLDVLVNSAGAWFLEPPVAAAMEAAALGQSVIFNATTLMEDAAWRRTMSIHLDGMFHCTREALKIMQVRRCGKIINFTALAPPNGLTGAPEQSTATGGVIGFTRSVAREVASLGIQVNAIAPGFTDTPLLDFVPPAVRQSFAAQNRDGRLRTPEEIAAVALFLASSDGDLISGQVISV